jgi:hypothetical protein
MGQRMDFIGNYIRKTSTGFEQHVKRYQAKNCGNCPLNGACHKSKDNRIIEINGNLKRQKQKAYVLLNSEEGIKRRKNDVSTSNPYSEISNKITGSGASCSVVKKKSLLNGVCFQSRKI